MSHSTVLVIVEEAEDEFAAIQAAEQALDPFDENMQVEPYVNGKVEADAIKYALDEPNLTDEEVEAILTTESEDTEEVLESYFGRRPEFRDGRYMEMSTYNPKSKWDWYSLGGRWDGQLPKKGQKEGVNVLQKKDLDMAGAIRKAEFEANEAYDTFEEVLASLNGIEPGPSWEEILKNNDQGEGSDYDSTKLEIARAQYHNDVWRSMMREKMNLFLSDPVDVFYYNKGGRQAYVENAKKNVISTFAVLDSDGEWWERGDMGWFGMVSDEMDGEEWLDTFNRLIENSSDDAWFLVYDVHI